MRTVFVIGAILTGLLVLSTLICGLWLQYSGKPVQKSDRTFHRNIALATTFCTLATLVFGLAG